MRRSMGMAVVIALGLGCGGDDDSPPNDTDVFTNSDMIEEYSAVICQVAVDCVCWDDFEGCRQDWISIFCDETDCDAELPATQAQLDSCIDDTMAIPCDATALPDSCTPVLQAEVTLVCAQATAEHRH
jgi:hypothetical protein